MPSFSFYKEFIVTELYLFKIEWSVSIWTLEVRKKNNYVGTENFKLTLSMQVNRYAAMLIQMS